MVDVLNLALPFFGLILLGFASGRLFPLPERELGWLNFFIFYIALPPLFFQLISRTPFEQLANGRFVLATALSTALAFALSFLLCFWLRGKASEATIAGTVGGYANIGYLGPGLTLAALGSQATVPTALIFTFDSHFSVFGGAVPDGALRRREEEYRRNRASSLLVPRLTHPFIIATALGVLAAWAHVRPPVALDRMLEVLMNAAAPCALFALGVTVALRPLKRVPPDVPALVAIKLIVHPLIAWTLLSLIGNFDPVWVYTAVLMASLRPRSTPS